MVQHRQPDRIRETAESGDATSIALFGSMARAEDIETSNYDFVADFKPRPLDR